MKLKINRVEIITDDEIICSLCKRLIDWEVMSEIEYREWEISGMCKECQDDYFKWED